MAFIKSAEVLFLFTWALYGYAIPKFNVPEYLHMQHFIINMKTQKCYIKRVVKVLRRYTF